MTRPLIKVTSPSFCKNDLLIQELRSCPFEIELNSDGKRLCGDALAAYLSDADGAIIGLESIDARLLACCPRLKMVSKFGVGLDNIDQDACDQFGVSIGWTPGVNRRSVAEMTVALIIGLCRNLFATSSKLRGGVWDKNGGRQLSGLAVGIIGLGNVGQELVRLLKPFDCVILANDIADRGDFCRAEGVTLESKERVFSQADLVTLHVPLNRETTYLVNANSLRLMKQSSFLINTSRGRVVDQEALKRALKTMQIAGAAIDVYEEEPPSDRELLELPNLVSTPHVAGNAWEAVIAMGRSAIQHVNEFFCGGMVRNVIAPEFAVHCLRRTA